MLYPTELRGRAADMVRRSPCRDSREARKAEPVRCKSGAEHATMTAHPNQVSMDQLFLFPGALERDPAVEAWMHDRAGPLGTIAQRWFDVLRGCGDDVRELLHDGHPTACVGEAAFAYVNAFRAHVDVGFFRGAELADPSGLLEGTGKRMRHVKLSPERDVDAAALRKLIQTAYLDMRARLAQK